MTKKLVSLSANTATTSTNDVDPVGLSLSSDEEEEMHGKGVKNRHINKRTPVRFRLTRNSKDNENKKGSAVESNRSNSSSNSISSSQDENKNHPSSHHSNHKDDDNASNSGSDSSQSLGPPMPVPTPHRNARNNRRAASARPSLARHRGRLNNYSRRDITLALRAVSMEQLASLTRSLYNTDERVVLHSLTQLHGFINDHEVWQQEQQAQGYEGDNSLELGILRRGGHLALVQAVRNHMSVAAITCMAWAALAWMCERTTIKSALLKQGTLPLALYTLQYHGLPIRKRWGDNTTNNAEADWTVVTEAIYVIGHLSTIPKVAHQARYREMDLWQELIPQLRLAYKQGTQNPNIAAVESAVDAFLFCSYEWAKHKSPDILRGVWQAGSLSFIVCLLQEALVYVQAAMEVQKFDSAAVYVERLTTGCRIVTLWAKTPGVPGVHNALVEAGALTVAAELVRLAPRGTPLRKAANPCLRAMVPKTED